MRLYSLLAAWLLCAFAPALIVQFGTFGHVDVNTNLNGPIVGVWIGGYLLQFAIFFWLSRIAGKGVFAGWFVASILPWGVDWTLPVSPLFALLWVPLGVGMAAYIARSAGRAQELRERGIRASGVVLQVYEPAMNTIVNNAYIKRKVRLRIERSDGKSPYEGTLNGLFMIGNVPSAGDRIPLLVDPSDPQHFDYDENAASPEAPHAAPRTRTKAGASPIS